jgi:hypothetical protein
MKATLSRVGLNELLGVAVCCIKPLAIEILLRPAATLWE